MEVETICRYNLPVCVVILNNNGVYRGTDENLGGGADVAPTVFVKDARYEKLMEAFGGVGVLRHHAGRTAQRAWNEAIRSRQPDADQRHHRRDRRHRERPHHQPEPDRGRQEEVTAIRHSANARSNHMSGNATPRRHQDHRLHARAGGPGLHAAAGLVRRRRDQGRAPRLGRRDAQPAARHPRCRRAVLHDAQQQQALADARHQEARGQGGAREADQGVRRDGRELRPGALDRMGFTWEHIQELNPRHDPRVGQGLLPTATTTRT